MLSNKWESRPIGFRPGDHNATKTGYTDHANEEDFLPSGLSDRFLLQFKCNRSGKELPFPVQLHHMLDMVEHQGLSEIVSWACHGRCFVVHKQKEFVDEIMKQWFRQTKFQSFQRQLNLYGFKRINSGKDKGAYYHELFLRTKRFLAYRINRIKIKGNKVRQAATPNSVPDFYAMSFLPTTHPVPCNSNNPTSTQIVAVTDPGPAPSKRTIVPGYPIQETSSTVEKKLYVSKQPQNDSKVYDPDVDMASATGQLFACDSRALYPTQNPVQSFKSVTVPNLGTFSSQNETRTRLGTIQVLPQFRCLQPQPVPSIPTNPYAIPTLNHTPVGIFPARSNSPAWFRQEQQDLDVDEDSFDELIESLIDEPRAAALTTPVRPDQSAQF